MSDEQKALIERCKSENLLISTTSGYSWKIETLSGGVVGNVADDVYWPISNKFEFVKERANYETSYYRPI